ncbi:uncharacterized protein FFB20_02524 [Fusarium fujikuroi]|nr:uncharacterized protein FFB20_02524 [Fusarium fujikuroi]SCN82585.1 uncharacterized protein FFE2_05148 [Fusarium fujikuroi]SCN84276.1 uncharacterized protein FFC1_04496 [Fusarium fujikuroi]SCN85324.1 uncharacterized protein FFM5_03636 [Fusarium fujikuroi]SCO34734.1 uncharacterized protein FFNC_04005 [Fusarium fujikuroi]
MGMCQDSFPEYQPRCYVALLVELLSTLCGTYIPIRGPVS